jgi:hypothetical protein
MTTPGARVTSERASGAEDVGVDELVAELTLWVMLGDEGAVVGEFGVEVVEACGGDGVELGPVGAGFEGSEFFFDEWKDLLDCGPLGFPGEVDGEGRALVAGA